LPLFLLTRCALAVVFVDMLLTGLQEIEIMLKTKKKAEIRT
jgi:hypothetical protein